LSRCAGVAFFGIRCFSCHAALIAIASFRPAIDAAFSSEPRVLEPPICEERRAKARPFQFVALRRVVELALSQLSERDTHGLDPRQSVATSWWPGIPRMVWHDRTQSF